MAEWKTRRSQKPMVRKHRVGSTPTLGTRNARALDGGALVKPTLTVAMIHQIIYL